MDRKKQQYNCGDQELFDALPGGVRQCLNDRYLTIIKANPAFLSLLGFTQRELEERFHNHFLKLIHPADRKMVLTEIEKQIGDEQKAALNFRVLCNNGNYIWVIDHVQLIYKNDEECLLSVMVDISETKDAKEELRLSLERYQIVMDQASDIIFEWDILKDTLVYSDNWRKKFGYRLATENITEEFSNIKYVYPDDEETFKQLMESARSGKPYSTVEMRIANHEGKYIWCRIRTTDQYDEHGNPIKTVGVITDIDDEKRMIEELRHRAECDALTGLYNRKETETQIRTYLEKKPTDKCALFMIDTDNFKLVNDSSGHLFGDAVLTELAAGMKGLTRSKDIVGRIGGDEFTIFMTGIPSKEVAEKKASRLIEMFGQLFQKEKNTIKITCSIGISVYPDDGEDFQSLYHCADQALYQAKSQGKNQYVMYADDSSFSMEKAGYSSLGATIDSDQRVTGIPAELITYVFQLLYDTEDIDKAISLVLEIVGKRFDVSRAYIFEDSEDGRFTDNTYEWCNEGINPEKDNLQHMSYEALENYERVFDDNSIFYCRDINVLPTSQMELLKAQGIYSTLQCAIKNDGAYCGFVGFDECTGRRLWTKEEIGVLSIVSQLLTTFLQKKRAVDRDHQMAIQMRTILDTQNAYIYVIRANSYELLYLNQKTRELDSNAKAGMTCYEAFFSREERCENCPLVPGGANEIYNPQYNVWTHVHIAPMKWNDSDAYLLSCYDITEYKKL